MDFGEGSNGGFLAGAKSFLPRIKERINDLKTLSAVERYVQLLETKSWVFELAAEDDIASYLMIPVSRLRSFRKSKA